jgi:membrane carboxypeptidase/penicillin-binding protein
MLAGLLKGPERYNPRRFADRAILRRNTVLEIMRREGAITNEDASLAKAFPLQLAQRTESGDVAPYFLEWVRAQLLEHFGERLYDEGLKVYTSLDVDMQVQTPDVRGVHGAIGRRWRDRRRQLTVPAGRLRCRRPAHRRGSCNGGRPRLW